MPRGRKPAAAKMAAPEKKEGSITLTKEQFETLRKASALIGDARATLNNLDDCETIAALAFGAGKAYLNADQAEDLLDDVIREVNPDSDLDWDDDDDDN